MDPPAPAPAPSSTPAPSSSSANPPPTASKRKYDEIVASWGTLLDAPQGKQKRRKREAIETKSAADKLIALAKFFVRAVHPFLDISMALYHGALSHWGPQPSADEPNTTVLSAEEQAERKMCVDAFDKMLAASPDSLDLLREFYQNEKEWHCLVKQFRDAASTARQGDTSTLKHKVDYVLPTGVMHLEPKVGGTDSKSDRGRNHPMLRRFLAPPSVCVLLDGVSVPEEGGADPVPQPTEEAKQTLKELMNGKLKLTAREYPSCFYAEGTVYDAKNPGLGLFKSQFILRILRHIWTAPSSAMKGPVDGVPKMCNARSLGQRKVTGRWIAYACCQGRTMISAHAWSVKDGQYKYTKLFNNVVKLFEENPNQAWIEETLEYFQKGIFDSGDSADDNSDDEDDGDDITAAILKSAVAPAAPPAAGSSTEGTS